MHKQFQNPHQQSLRIGVKIDYNFKDKREQLIKMFRRLSRQGMKAWMEEEGLQLRLVFSGRGRYDYGLNSPRVYEPTTLPIYYTKEGGYDVIFITKYTPDRKVFTERLEWLQECILKPIRGGREEFVLIKDGKIETYESWPTILRGPQIKNLQEGS